MNKIGRNTKMTEKCNCDKDEKQTWLMSVIDGIEIIQRHSGATGKDADSKDAACWRGW